MAPRSSAAARCLASRLRAAGWSEPERLWFEAGEPVLTNVARDFGVVQEAAKVAQQPMDEVLRRIYETPCHGWAGSGASHVLSLAVDFATWKKLRREQGMASSAIVEMWSDLIRCLHPEPGKTRVRAGKRRPSSRPP